MPCLSAAEHLVRRPRRGPDRTQCRRPIAIEDWPSWCCGAQRGVACRRRSSFTSPDLTILALKGLWKIKSMTLAFRLSVRLKSALPVMPQMPILGRQWRSTVLVVVRSSRPVIYLAYTCGTRSRAASEVLHTSYMLKYLSRFIYPALDYVAFPEHTAKKPKETAKIRHPSIIRGNSME